MRIRLVFVLLVLGLWLPDRVPAYAQTRTAAPVFELRPSEVETLAKMVDVERMMDRRGQVAPDEDLRGYVSSVGEALIPSDFVDSRLAVRFKLLRAAEPNAFALPNGSIYVTLGLLAQFENEAQLAAVLAHEVAHATRYHYFRFDRDYRSASAAVNLLGIATAAVGGWGGLLTQLGVQSLAIGTLYGYSRELEEEADRFALAAVADEGYDPGQVVALFRRLMIDYDGTHIETPLFYSDHPKLQTRIDYTNRLIKERGLVRDPAQARAERYQPFRRRAARDAVRLAIRDDLPRTAIAWAAEMVRQDPQAAESHYLKGEAHRALGFRPQDLLAKPPTKEEKQREASKKLKKTPAEIEAELAATAQGKADWTKNSGAALTEYTTAIALDAAFAPSYAGLALLQAKLGRYVEAVASADTFLELAAPGDLERARLQRLRDEWKTKVPPPSGAHSAAGSAHDEQGGPDHDDPHTP